MNLVRISRDSVGTKRAWNRNRNHEQETVTNKE